MRNLTALLTITLALVIAMPAAAQRDRSDGPNRYENRGRRVSVEGRVRSFSRERDGVRVVLDRGNYSFFVPTSVLGRRALRVGMELRLAGIVRGGSVWVDDIGWPSDVERNDETLNGRVERINPYERRLVLRDRGGKLIDVDTRSVVEERRRGLDLGDVHRGDRVTLRGRWERGTFRAFRIESVSAR